jgi:nucleoside-diphosphate-sugar epimerase
MTVDGGRSNALVTGTSALVSGATGFLGGYLLDRLREMGFQVRALVRRRNASVGLVRTGCETCVGDVLNRASLQAAVSGQGLVFHTAGRVSDWGTRREFWQANVEGTANVIAACREAGVKRLIHVSSLSVLGLPRSGERIDENTPPDDRARDYYTVSKIAGERLVRQAHQCRGLETVIIRSGVIWGPGQNPILSRMADLMRRRRFFLIDGGRNQVGLSHVENLSQGMILAALAPEAAGQVYHLTDGESITAHAAFRALAAVVGVDPPRFSLPFPAAFAMAAAMEWIARLRRAARPPMLTRYAVRMVASDSRYDISKARKELGYNPRLTFNQGIETLFSTGKPQ